jgi:hypothetical protein
VSDRVERVRWTGDDFGTTEGVDAIVAGLPAATAKVAFSMHAFLNPMISVDGDTATGSWLLWIASIYDDIQARST